MKTKRLFLAGVSVLALAACGGSSEFSASLTGAAEKPAAVTTEGSGSATVTLDGKSLEVTGRFEDLSANATVAHIHGPADENSVADPLCTLTVQASPTGTISAGSGTNSCGDLELTDAQVTDLENGRWYVNIHTSTNTAGELRGQLRKKD